MSAPVLSIPSAMWEQVVDHLASGPEEQLAFMLVRWDGDLGQVFDLRLVRASGFDLQLPWHISLADEERAEVIGWAHEGNGALLEMDVHRGPWPARFSASDKEGLDEFVPHVWWRLRHRPYAALVMGEQGFDALVWRSGPGEPEQLTKLLVDGRSAARPTGLSLARWD
jgi:hypothetical protein